MPFMKPPPEALTLINQITRTIDKPEIFDHSFQWQGKRGHTSTVRVTIFRHRGANLVILQDLGKGTSVTNACEQIATEVGALKSLDPWKTVWIECYPGNTQDVIWSIDRIFMDYHRGAYVSPTWGPVRDKRVIDFLRANLKV